MKHRWLCIFLTVPWILSAVPLSLEKARDLAVGHDQELQATTQETEAAKQQRQAAFSQFLPSLDFEGGYRRDDALMHYDTGLEKLPIYDFTGQQQMLFAGFRINQSLGQHDNVQATIKATQPLFTGGKIWRNWKIHQELETVSQQQTELQRQETMLTVDEAYWRVAELQAKVQLAKTYRHAVEQHVGELNNYLDAGLVTRNDLLKAKVKLSEADLDLQRAEDGYTLAVMDLNRNLGWSSNTPVELSDSLDALPNETAGDPHPDQRPELQALSEVCRIQQQMVGVKFADYLPQIELVGDYQTTRPNPYNSFKDEYGDVWQISLLCSMNLFNFNRTGNEVSAARAEKRAAELRYQDTADKINLQISQEQFQLNEAEKRVEMARTNLEQAEENLKECNDRFHDGVLKSTDVLDAESLWQQAKTSLIEALSARNVQITRTRKACGNL